MNHDEVCLAAITSPMTAIYLNSGAPTSAKNLSASTLCRNFVHDYFCNAAIPLSRRLCDRCLHRAHAASCPSPREECTCGFSKLFWADLAADLEFERSEPELSVTDPQPSVGNAASTRLLASHDDDGMSMALNCVSELPPPPTKLPTTHARFGRKATGEGRKVTTGLSRAGDFCPRSKGLGFFT